MSVTKHKGIVIQWEDSQGFGYLRGETSNQKIFLHMSAFPHTRRRPKLGEAIYYQVVTGKDGKLKATNASFSLGHEQTLHSPKTNSYKNIRASYKTVRQQYQQRQFLINTLILSLILAIVAIAFFLIK